MAREYLTGGEVTQVIVPQGPPTRTEIWEETIGLLEEAPAAYVETYPFREAPDDQIEGYNNLWQFHDYNPDADVWNHVAVQGAVGEYGFPKDVLAALKHLNTPDMRLTKRAMKEGVLGVKALQFLGKIISFPDHELLDAVRLAVPQHVRRLSIQTRQGVKGQDLASLQEVPITLAVDLLKHPDYSGLESGFVYYNSGNKQFRNLLAINGVIRQLLPNFTKTAAAYKKSRG